jgi:hypothetical protein
VEPSADARPDWVALAGAALTVALHFVLQARGPSLAFIVGACLFWACFVAVRAHRDTGVFRRWGFRTDNLAGASLGPALLFVFVAGCFALYAAWRGAIAFRPHALWLFLLYPFWGLIQQFVALAIVVSNLEKFPRLGQRRVLVLLAGAVLFGLVHAPDPLAVAATFALELALIPLYLRWRNLWPLGVVHGWLGGLFYLWILERDLWAEHFA